MTPHPSESLLAALALGALQGPAEVLPISSSAHVELLAGRLGSRGAARKELAVALHAGSAAALLAAGVRPRRPGWAALTLLAPSAAGLAAARLVEERLGGPVATAAGLVAGGVALVVADGRAQRGRRKRRGGAWRPAGGRGVVGRRAAWRGGGRALSDATAADALVLGAAQACALWPGVSRSGAVLTAARARGFSRPAAWALVRETAVPVLVAATALKGTRAVGRGADLRGPAAGAAAAALSTAAALRGGALAERVPAAGWAAYRCALAATVLAVRDTWRR